MNTARKHLRDNFEPIVLLTILLVTICVNLLSTMYSRYYNAMDNPMDYVTNVRTCTLNANELVKNNIERSTLAEEKEIHEETLIKINELYVGIVAKLEDGVYNKQGVRNYCDTVSVYSRSM